MISRLKNYVRNRLSVTSQTDKSTEGQIIYYDQASARYSEDRYPERAETYAQYLFLIRRQLLISFLKGIENSLPSGARLLEIGCADGIIMRAIEEHFPGRFSEMVGVDISPKMLEKAKRMNENQKARFQLADEAFPGQFDVVVELGVFPPHLERKFEGVAKLIRGGGYYIHSYTGRKSSFNAFKMKNIAWTKQLISYKAYKEIASVRFFLQKSSVYAFFVPKLWAFPSVGRPLQRSFDALLKYLMPERFIEQVFLLKKKT